MPKKKTEKRSETRTTGLPKAQNTRYHFDIYAIVEAPQELYFGHETQVNVNIVETVKVALSNGEVVEKCYISPTKRRGVERRCLIWAPANDGRLLGDVWQCGIPHTCGCPECPICRVYGALITKDTKNQVKPLGEEVAKREPMTFIGRLTHGGGVAIQPLPSELKQRAMHPSLLRREGGEEVGKKPTPMPFQREYNEPGLLYPIYNHCLSVEEDEFAAVAYAFLDALTRLGASNPKGVTLKEAPFHKGESAPLLVLDRYWVPLGKRPVVSPSEMDVEKALEQFRRAALWVDGDGNAVKDGVYEGEYFTRWIGNAALKKLQEYAKAFCQQVLLQGEGQEGSGSK